eukprot:17048-Heterocapsa_arctica.AAC.1
MTESFRSTSEWNFKKKFASESCWARRRTRLSRSVGGYCARAKPAAQPGSGRQRSREPSLGVHSPCVVRRSAGSCPRTGMMMLK